MSLITIHPSGLSTITDVSEGARLRVAQSLREAAEAIEKGGKVLNGGIHLQMPAHDRFVITANLVLEAKS